MRTVLGRDNAARQVRGLLPQQRELRWIERHRGRGSAIAGKDRRDGRAMEWDARNGVLQRLGRKHGIPTPISDVIVPILKSLSPSS